MRDSGDRERSFVIRQLESCDTDLMAEAVVQLKPESRSLPISSETCRPFLADRRNVFALATEDGAAIGYAVAYVLSRVDREVPMVLLYEVEVHPEHRRRGVGRSLVDHIREISREVGASKMWTLTDEANRAARTLYESAGGIDAGESLLIAWSEERLGDDDG